jgi:hypothetical protein
VRGVLKNAKIPPQEMHKMRERGDRRFAIYFVNVRTSYCTYVSVYVSMYVCTVWYPVSTCRTGTRTTTVLTTRTNTDCMYVGSAIRSTSSTDTHTTSHSRDDEMMAQNNIRYGVFRITGRWS